MQHRRLSSGSGLSRAVARESQGALLPALGSTFLKKEIAKNKVIKNT